MAAGGLFNRKEMNVNTIQNQTPNVKREQNIAESTLNSIIQMRAELDGLTRRLYVAMEAIAEIHGLDRCPNCDRYCQDTAVIPTGDDFGPAYEEVCGHCHPEQWGGR